MPQKRPPTVKARPIKGKDESFTARITAETREALRKSAEVEGHSMSTELELLLRTALQAKNVARAQVDLIFDAGWQAALRIIEMDGGKGPADSARVYLSLRHLLDVMAQELPVPVADTSFAEVATLSEEIDTLRGQRRRHLKVEGDELSKADLLGDLESRRQAVLDTLHHDAQRAAAEAKSFYSALASRPV